MNVLHLFEVGEVSVWAESDADRLLLVRLANALADDPAVRLSVMLDLLDRHDAAPRGEGA